MPNNQKHTIFGHMYLCQDSEWLAILFGYRMSGYQIVLMMFGYRIVTRLESFIRDKIALSVFFITWSSLVTLFFIMGPCT
jgi:hypothetical protein